MPNLAPITHELSTKMNITLSY